MADRDVGIPSNIVLKTTIPRIWRMVILIDGIYDADGDAGENNDDDNCNNAPDNDDDDDDDNCNDNDNDNDVVTAS